MPFLAVEKSDVGERSRTAKSPARPSDPWISWSAEVKMAMVVVKSMCRMDRTAGHAVANRGGEELPS